MKRGIVLTLLLPLLFACDRGGDASSNTQGPAAAPQPSSGAGGSSSNSGNAGSSGASGNAGSAASGSGTSGSSSASGPGGEYTVAAGETLGGIANKHGVSVQDLARWNNISDPNRIHQGQKLRLGEPGS